MGDVGSIPLGFLAAALGLEGLRRDLWPFWFPMLVFSPFIVDASVTLLRRLMRGERVWQAHREHHYQIMVRSGLGHRVTALLWYGLMALIAASACIAVSIARRDWGLILGFWVVVYLVLGYAVNAKCRRRHRRAYPMLNVRVRSLLVMLFDLAALAMAWWGAYLLRFNLSVPAEYFDAMLRTVTWAVPLQAIVFRVFGLYQGIWRFASLHDLFRIARAIAASTLLLAMVLLIFRPVPSVPRSVLLLQPVLVMILMGGARVLYRAWKEHRLYGALRMQGKPVLVLGAGEAASSLLRELSRSSEWRVVGLLDDNPRKHKAYIGRTACSRSGVGTRPLGARASGATRDHRHAWCQSRRAQAGGHTVRTRRRSAADRTGIRRLDERQGHGFEGAQRRGRGSARARSGVDRHPAAQDGPGRQGGHGHRCGRLDRFGTVPADRTVRPGATGVLRTQRVLPLSVA